VSPRGVQEAGGIAVNHEQEMVRQFHRAFNFTLHDAPTPITAYQARRRSDLLDEEAEELRRALLRKDVVAIADALADVLYVVYGTAVACGIDVEPIFKEVHRSNMTKDQPAGDSDKAIKGAGFSPPNLSHLLNQEGSPR
jgi:predicted HAD superfamily Cof-like phosphohydrolase